MIAIVAPPAPQFIPQELINQPIPVLNPPPWLQAVQPGSTIQAVVQSTNADGLVTVVSSAGTLSFQAPTTVVNTSQILLQILQPTGGGTQPQVQIIQVTAPPPPPAFNGAILTDVAPQGIASLPIPGAVVIAQVERTLAPVDGPTLAVQNAIGAAAGTTPGSVATSPILAGASPLAGAVAAAAINAVPVATATLPTVPTALLAQALASVQPTGAITSQAILPGQRSPNQGATAGQQQPDEEQVGTAGQQTASTNQTAVPSNPSGGPGASTVEAAQTLANAEAAQSASAAGPPPPATAPPPPATGQPTTTTATVTAPSLAPESQTVPLALANATLGQRIAVRIVTITPPDAPNYANVGQAVAVDPSVSGVGAATAGSTVAQAKAASSFVATVVGSDASGQPILSTGPLLITLAAGAPPPGTKVTLTVVPIADSAVASAAIPASAEVASAAALLNASQGTSAAAAVNALVPQAGPALAAQMAFYAGALQQGDIKAWLGDAARNALDRTQRGRAALGSISDEMNNSQEVNAGAGPGNWQAMTIPFSNGPVVDPIRLYLLQTNPDDEKDAEAPTNSTDATRFLVDVQLTQLGRFQIDGFARPDRLDLIIRTPAPLDAALKTGIEQVYINTASARGLGGLIAFQVSPPIVPPTPMPPPRPSAGILV